MPRDDLSIDFVPNRRIMVVTDHQDCGSVLEEFTNRVANLPAEIAFMQDEITEKDRMVEKLRSTASRADLQIQQWIRENGSHTPNPKEEKLKKVFDENMSKALQLQAEKLALCDKMEHVYHRHLLQLDKEIKKLQDRGEFPKEDVPSVFDDNGPAPINRVRVPGAVPAPLGPIANNATPVVHTRHPNQHPMRAPTVQSQSPQVPGASSSVPTTPAAAHLMSQRAREMSLGAVANKRQRLIGGLGALPSNSSGLARPPVGPGTPKPGTPSSSRAGSIGPRASQKSGATTKKVAPHRQGVAARKKIIKSNLGRIKHRSGNKNSPSSTNDSELSDPESGSGEDDDEAMSPTRGEGDDELGDLEDDEGADDKKYCTCQSVSYGDMVACDNESCPFEWFHWSCVGLTKEPTGTWICPVCTKNGVKKG
ncbi:hypothetical protein BP6252_09177 [Coleophoma cylindrospora]|uniref:Chromatin modification-related protein n=1 Tax=Coleophoma cylindrospora TaxID=1849047 RepID=A0A3D8R1I9_9HELO|nr:hypothetical protein BP6252_09177 [Coleophoma cylindrospora]